MVEQQKVSINKSKKSVNRGGAPKPHFRNQMDTNIRSYLLPCPGKRKRIENLGVIVLSKEKIVRKQIEKRKSLPFSTPPAVYINSHWIAQTVVIIPHVHYSN